MELDDLKQSWNEQSETELKNLNNNFMEMIHNKSYGPLAEMKSKIKQQLFITFPLCIAIFIYALTKRPELFKDFFSMIFYFGFCICVTVGIYWSNYKLINRMQQADLPVKETIEKNIKTLEGNFNKIAFLAKVYFVITIVLVEVFMYLHLLKAFEPWYACSFFIRIAIYLALFIILIFGRKLSYQKNLGKHIDYLKDLLQKIK